jgi:hypothetical protein
MDPLPPEYVMIEGKEYPIIYSVTANGEMIRSVIYVDVDGDGKTYSFPIVNENGIDNILTGPLQGKPVSASTPAQGGRRRSRRRKSRKSKRSRRV